VTLGEITALTAAALVTAGLLSVIVFPLLAVTLLREVPVRIPTKGDQ